MRPHTQVNVTPVLWGAELGWIPGSDRATLPWEH